MKPFISFQELPNMFAPDLISVTAVNDLTSKKIEEKHVKADSINRYKDKLIMRETAIVINQAVKGRGNNYKYAPGEIRPEVHKAFDHLRTLVMPLGGTFSSHEEQAAYIYNRILPHLETIAPRNINSFPSYHKLVNHIKMHFRPAKVQPKKADFIKA